MKCSIKDCNRRLGLGDRLFCIECRNNWRNFLKLRGVEFQALTEEQTQELLKEYKEEAKK